MAVYILKFEKFKHRDGREKWAREDMGSCGFPGLVRVNMIDPENGEVLDAVDFHSEEYAAAFAYGMNERYRAFGGVEEARA
jgi:hypothetical protein